MPDGSMYLGGGIGLAPQPQPAPSPPFPRPEVPSTAVPVDAVAKKAAKDLALYAIGKGWTVLVTRARGCFPHGSTGRPGPPRDSLAVRMARGDDRAVAVYVQGSAWTWDTLYRWQVGHWHRKLKTITELRETL